MNYLRKSIVLCYLNLHNLRGNSVNIGKFNVKVISWFMIYEKDIHESPDSNTPDNYILCTFNSHNCLFTGYQPDPPENCHLNVKKLPET